MQEYAAVLPGHNSLVLIAVTAMQVREAFMKKVSRERVGMELEGMFDGMQCICSRMMQLIH